MGTFGVREHVGLVVVNVQGSLRTRQSQLAQRPCKGDVQGIGALWAMR